MPPPSAVGQIYEVTVKGDCDGQVVMNILHYRLVSVGADVFSVSEGLINAFVDVAGPLESMRSAQSEHYLTTDVRVQCIHPTRYRYVNRFFGDTKPGLFAGVMLPSAVQVDVTKQTDFTDPWSHGQLRMAGVPAEGIEESMLTAAYYVTATNAFGWLPGDLGVGAPLWKPIILHRALPDTSQLLTAYVVEEQARVSQRRVVGRGI